MAKTNGRKRVGLQRCLRRRPLCQTSVRHGKVHIFYFFKYIFVFLLPSTDAMHTYIRVQR